MFFLLSFFWFIREGKIILFYLYLWQLKEYHIGRFLDHFRTEKGQRLILNKINLLKIGILFALLYFLFAEKQIGREEFLLFLGGLIVFLYFLEVLSVFKNLFQKTLKKPVLTKKTAFLIPIALLVEILVFFIVLAKTKDVFFFALWLLLFDICTPLISSFIVLFFQPLTVLLRNQIIKKARRKRVQHKDLSVVGITGSYGKTSTKEFLAIILSDKFKVLKTKQHQNSEVGISRCILNDLKPEHKVFIVEMGAYGRGGVRLLSDIVRPKIGILTGINEQHMALFGSQGKIIKTKYELIEALPKDGLAILNGNNKYCLDLYKMAGVAKRLYCAKKSEPEKMLQPDIWAEDIRVEKEFISFRVFAKGEEGADFRVNVLGKQNVSNILAAAVAAKELGMNLEEISRACLKIKPEQGTMKLLGNEKELNILDASYSANPDGVIADLEYLEIYPGKKVIIMPCLIELGKAAKEVHKRIGRKIGRICDLAIITTKEHFDKIKEGAMENRMKEENIVFSENPKEIIRRIDIFSVAGDVILLEGRVPKELIKELSK